LLTLVKITVGSVYETGLIRDFWKQRILRCRFPNLKFGSLESVHLDEPPVWKCIKSELATTNRKNYRGVHAKIHSLLVKIRIFSSKTKFQILTPSSFFCLTLCDHKLKALSFNILPFKIGQENELGVKNRNFVFDEKFLILTKSETPSSRTSLH